MDRTSIAEDEVEARNVRQFREARVPDEVWAAPVKALDVTREGFRQATAKKYGDEFLAVEPIMRTAKYATNPLFVVAPMANGVTSSCTPSAAERPPKHSAGDGMGKRTSSTRQPRARATSGRRVLGVCPLIG